MIGEQAEERSPQLSNTFTQNLTSANGPMGEEREPSERV